MKLVYLDIETTGLDSEIHAITQLAAIIEVDGAELQKINLKIRPNLEHSITRGALETTKVSYDTIMGYELSQFSAYIKLVSILDKYINKFDPDDKFYLIGYNSHSFDSKFLRKFFEMHNNKYYGSYFYYPSIDVMILAAFAAMGQRCKLPNFKLMTVAKSLGIEVDESRAHDAMYDVKITRDIYNIIQKGLK